MSAFWLRVVITALDAAALLLVMAWTYSRDGHPPLDELIIATVAAAVVIWGNGFMYGAGMERKRRDRGYPFWRLEP
jgi:hypothetical protein